MDEHLFSDVKALMDMGFGDDRILKQIYRACENSEAISNYERSYVRGLVDEHLRKPSQPTSETKDSDTSKSAIGTTNNATTANQITTTTTQTQQDSKSTGSSKKLVLFAIVGIVIVLGVGAAFILTTPILPINQPPPVVQPPGVVDPGDDTTIQSDFTVTTDLPSYGKSDLMVISGITSSLEPISVSIHDPLDNIVWNELVVPQNGVYSTIIIVGGPGWNDSGAYSVSVFDGIDRKSHTFTFN